MPIKDKSDNVIPTKNGDVLIIRLKGRLDALSSTEIEKKISHYIQDEKNLLLDFKDIEYISSAGMRLLLTIAKKLRTQSGKLVLFSINNRVLDVLKMSGFDHLMDLQINENEALTKI